MGSRSTGTNNNDNTGPSGNMTVRVIADFNSVASKAEDASSIYRTLRPFWASTSTSHLVDPAEKVLSMVPSSRSAVLNYLGMLTHEATHLYFMKKENPHFGSDSGSVERAVRRLSTNFEGLLSSTEQKVLASHVLKYLCSLLAEICQCNYERPLAQQTGVAPRNLLHLFESSPSVAGILKLFDKAVAILLDGAPEECFHTLVDASMHGFCFDWVWLHLAWSFPVPIMTFLLNLGAEQFKQYIATIATLEQQSNPAALFETHQIYKRKFTTSCETFAYLASKRRPELRCVVRDMLIKGIELLDSSSDMAITSETDLSIPFIFKLLAASSEFLGFLLPRLSSNLELHQPWAMAIKSGAIEIIDEILSIITSSVHSQALFVMSERDSIGQCVLNSTKLREYISGAMCSGERGKFSIKFLNAFCVVTGPLKTAEVIARFIMEARDSQQLTALCALLIATEHIMPNSPRQGITSLIRLRNILEFENRNIATRRQIAEGVSGSAMETNDADNSANVGWLHNLLTLNEWQKTAHESHPIAFLRFEMTKHYGQLMVYVNDKTIENERERDSMIATLMKTFIQFTHSIEPPPILKPKYAYKICAQFASLLILLLRNVAKDDRPLAPALYFSSCALVSQFLDSQPFYVRKQFMTHFMDEALARVVELFGAASKYSYEKEKEKNVMNSLDPNIAGCLGEAFKEYMNDEIASESLLQRLRRMPIGGRNPLEIANCGIIGKGARKQKELKLKRGELFRRPLFVHSLYNFGGTKNGDDQFVPILSAYKHLATTLTDRMCKEGLTASFVWYDWEIEKEIAHKYIEVANTLSNVPFAWPLLRLIAEIHPSLWYCIPVLKALLASIMIRFENHPSQKSKPQEFDIDSLKRLFFVFIKGKVVPAEFAVFLQVIPNISHREAFLILLDLWRYLQSIVNVFKISAISEALESTQTTVNIPPIKGEVLPFMTAFRLVIQRNITQLAYLFPYLRKLGLSKNVE
ncbi:unnamed protein product [Anisakis simplex]|uniref:INTS5_C domain-containing protein n=1 Tax=Anisakis simplex TaxID=6269 RepID=A0A0M3K3J3_ANISI|nr:unnamed protein product [Anisakis simplex]